MRGIGIAVGVFAGMVAAVAVSINLPSQSGVSGDISSITSITDSSANPADSGFIRNGNNTTVLACETATPGTDMTWTCNTSNRWVSSVPVVASEFRTAAGYFIASDDSNAVSVATNTAFNLGSTASVLMYSGIQSPTSTIFSLGSASRALVIMERDDAGTNFGHALQTNPTIYLHSSDATNTAQWISLAHDQTNSVVGSGSGAVNIQPNRSNVTKGGSLSITQNQESLTCSGGGSATLVTSSLIPGGAFLFGVTTRITTALTGSTGFNVGDGTDADLYGVQSAATQGSTTNNSNATANWANPQLAAGNVTLTFAGGNCTAGVVAVVASYIALVAPTSN
jgi:hypothetical protein